MDAGLNIKPEVHGVCIISRRGAIVGTIPLGVSEKLARKIAKDAEAAKDKADSASDAAEDPF
jgi:hypothetical protein